jgi:predicted transcriptional regulator
MTARRADAGRGGPADAGTAGHTGRADAGTAARTRPAEAGHVRPGRPADAGTTGQTGRAGAGTTGRGEHADAPDRDPDAVRRFIERLASVLSEAGFPRMPARVFASLLASDPGRLNAAELAGLLQVSPAAVSGSVRYLSQLGLVSKESEPGSRRVGYRVPDDVWDQILRLRDQVMKRWTATMRDGVEVLGAGSPAGHRLTESIRYFEFVGAELPQLIERWRDLQAAAGDA